MKTVDQIIEEELLNEAVINKIKDWLKSMDPDKVAKKIVSTFKVKTPQDAKKFVKMTRTLNDPKFRIVLNQVMMAAGA